MSAGLGRWCNSLNHFTSIGRWMVLLTSHPTGFCTRRNSPGKQTRRGNNAHASPVRDAESTSGVRVDVGRRCTYLTPGKLSPTGEQRTLWCIMTPQMRNARVAWLDIVLLQQGGEKHYQWMNRMSGSLSAISHHFQIMKLVPKRKGAKTALFHWNLRCVKDASYQWRAPRWRLELGEWDGISIWVPRVTQSVSLPLLFLGLFVPVPQSFVRPQLTPPKCLPELGHRRGEERQTLVCEELSSLPGT